MVRAGTVGEDFLLWVSGDFAARGPGNDYHSIEAHPDVRGIWRETVRCRQVS